MTTFTIDNENTITALVGANTTSDPAFSYQQELETLAAGWPIQRLVDTWNGFAGAPPLGDLRPVKKFENKTKATRRIWEAIQKLAGNQVDTAHTDVAAAPAAKPAKAKKEPKAKTKAPKATKPAKATGDKTTAKARVIAMITKKGGATIEELCAETGWQKHTLRGAISILGSKGGLNINSSRRESDKARVYEVVR